MLLLMEEPIGEGSSPDWELMLRSWKTVETFLQQHVLPFLRPLSGVLLGAFAEEHLLQRDRAWLEADGAIRKLTELASDLFDLRVTGRRASEFASAWNNLAIQLDELRRTVLLSGEEGREPATLASFISACPTLLLQTLRECLDEARYMPVEISVNLDDDYEVKVFCHEELVRNIIMQLIDNVVTHRDPAYGHLTMSLDIGIVADHDQVKLIFRNTGTRPSGRPGNGIVDFQRRLRDFGASLQVVTPSKDWTFEVHLRLPYWSVSG
jgi:signal transduction histidine kinase